MDEYQQILEQIRMGEIPPGSQAARDAIEIMKRTEGVSSDQIQNYASVLGVQDAAPGPAPANPYEGMPTMPDLQAIVDAQGNLLPQYSLEAQLLDPTSISGYNQYQTFATGTGPSEYAKRSEEALDLKTAFERDRIAQEALGQTAQARSALAMRGGIGEGARERLAMQAGQGAMEARQGARQAQLLGLGDILSQDALARQQALGQFTQLGANIGQFNVGQKSRTEELNRQALLGDVEAQRLRDLEKYKAEISAWASGKSAESQERIAREEGK